MEVLPPFWIWQSHMVAHRPIRHFSPVKGNSTPYMCACGLNGSGVDPLYGRHCDINDYVWREDSGLLTNKADLRFNWDLVIQGKLETMNEATTLLENWSVMVQIESAASYVNVRQSSVHVKDRMYQSIKSYNMIVERLESICQCSYLTCLNWMRLYTIGLTNRFKNWVCVRQRSVPWLGQPDLDILRLLIMFFPLPLLFCRLSTIFFYRQWNIRNYSIPISWMFLAFVREKL